MAINDNNNFSFILIALIQIQIILSLQQTERQPQYPAAYLYHEQHPLLGLIMTFIGSSKDTAYHLHG
jgi:hypothetical protein